VSDKNYKCGNQSEQKGQFNSDLLLAMVLQPLWGYNQVSWHVAEVGDGSFLLAIPAAY